MTKTPPELKTLRDLIRYGATLFGRHGLFFGHGTESALDEAAWLALRALHLPPDLPDFYLEANLTEEEKREILQLFERRIKTRKPAAYLLREAHFCGLVFYVDERVMVPRSPIGEWIEKRFSPWLDNVEVGRILDLGTGSGCLAIAAANAFPEARVDAVDLSEEALEVARINISRHGLEERVFPIRADLFEGLEGKGYQLILANPPYVPAERYAALPPEYLHEPKEALLSPEGGLFHVKRILARAGEFLSEEGILVVEVGATWRRLQEAFPEVPFLWLELERGGEGVFLLTAQELWRRNFGIDEMAGSSFGERFRVTTFGESHGPALGCVVEGCPPGLELSEEDLQRELDRRRPGTSRFVTQRREPDRVRILSGVFEGRTTGTPIGLLIENVDARSKDYANLADRFRPGHADYTYLMKYGIRDYRGGGRASARETAMRVAAGAIAKKYLKERVGVEIRGYLSKLGPIEIPFLAFEAVEQNPFFAPNLEIVPELEEFLKKIQKAGDSVGARITVVATGVPVGLGEPVFDKLDADLAKGLMSIPAVKAVEVGDGTRCVEALGSQFRDEMVPEGFLSNHAGGILGGISSGQPIVVHLSLKPTSSIRLPGRTVNVRGEPVEVVTKGRHDPCVGLRAVPIAEAMVALVLMDHYLRHRAQNAEVVPPLEPLPEQAP